MPTFIPLPRMLLLTMRERLQDQLRFTLRRKWDIGTPLRPIVQVASITELQRELAAFDSDVQAVHKHSLVAVDLDTVCKCTNFPELVATWCRRYPFLHLILIVGEPSADSVRLANRVLQQAPMLSLVHSHHLQDSQVWCELLQHSVAFNVGSGILADLTSAALPTPLPAYKQVADIIRLAPQFSQVTALCGHLGCDRTALAKQMRRESQLAPKDVLILARVLYERKLKENGWAPKSVAAYLGVRDPKELRRYAQRGLPVGWWRLEHRSYKELVTIAAAALLSCVGISKVGGKCVHQLDTILSTLVGGEELTANAVA